MPAAVNNAVGVLGKAMEKLDASMLLQEYAPEHSESSLLSLEGELPVVWVMRDISKSGVIGDATTATKEKGDCILESVANGWAQVIQDIYAYPQP